MVGCDFVSSYIWRGQNLGNTSMQPTLGVEYKGLSLTAWGSVGLANLFDAKEFDLTLEYTTGGFNIGINIKNRTSKEGFGCRERILYRL